MDSPLLRFLRKRGVPEECLSRMEEEHIDDTVIDCMDDGTLSGYIPTYGDRIAARRFCLESKDTNTKESQKNSLLEKLKKKMGIDNDDKCLKGDETSAPKRKRQYAKCNKWAEKKTRRIELGWIHEGKQVRKRRGGGTRMLDVPKESKKLDLINFSKDLFFPNGKCKFGKFESFTHDILDFQEEAVLDDNITVGQLHTALRLGMLRFDLCTKSQIQTDNEESDEGKSDENNMEMRDTYTNDQVTDTIVILSSDYEIDADTLSSTSEVTFGPVLGEAVAGQLDDTLVYQPHVLFEGNGLGFTSFDLPSTSTSHITSAAGDEASINTASYEIVCVTIKLHRINLLEEMITQFNDPSLLKQTLKYSFIDERGADADGVSRDVYAAFWTEFMDRTAEGEEVRVPSLTNKWKKEEWKAIGRILLKGFKDHGYFPCRFAPAFSVALIFGENEVSDDMLLESLLLYISQSDRDLLTTALKENLLDEDGDELIDLLDRLNVTIIPTRENLKTILVSAAHKHLIQKPRYAAEHMSFTASYILKESFLSPQHVLLMYEEKKPTTRKFLKLLDASPTTQAENQSFGFLQQYIRGLDDAGLRRVLRFVTGSDVICVKKIEVLFTPVEGLARRPVAHTCGPTLELPMTYASYPELRADMDSILLNQNSSEFSIV